MPSQGHEDDASEAQARLDEELGARVGQTYWHVLGEREGGGRQADGDGVALGSVELLPAARVLAGRGADDAHDIPLAVRPWAVDDGDIVGWFAWRYVRPAASSGVSPAGPIVVRWSRDGLGYDGMLGVDTLDALLRLAAAAEDDLGGPAAIQAALDDAGHPAHETAHTVATLVRLWPRKRPLRSVRPGDASARMLALDEIETIEALGLAVLPATAAASEDADLRQRWPAQPLASVVDELPPAPLAIDAIELAFEHPIPDALRSLPAGAHGVRPQRDDRNGDGRHRASRSGGLQLDVDDVPPDEAQARLLAEAWRVIHLAPSFAESVVGEDWDAAREYLIEHEHLLGPECQDWPVWRAARDPGATRAGQPWLDAADALAERAPLAAEACVDNALVEADHPRVLDAIKRWRANLYG